MSDNDSPQDDAPKKGLRFSFKFTEEQYAQIKKQIDAEMRRVSWLPADMFEEEGRSTFDRGRTSWTVTPREAPTPNQWAVAHSGYLAHSGRRLSTFRMLYEDETPDTPSPLTLDDYAMGLLEQLDELQVQIDLKPALRDVAREDWGTLTRHEQELIDEKNRLKRDLVDCIIHLAHYPDLSPPRTAEGNMVLPQRLYDTAFKFNAWREERLTFGESTFANSVIKAYRREMRE